MTRSARSASGSLGGEKEDKETVQIRADVQKVEKKTQLLREQISVLKGLSQTQSELLEYQHKQEPAGSISVDAVATHVMSLSHSDQGKFLTS